MLNEIVRVSWVDRTRFRPRSVSLRDWLRPARSRTWWNQIARRLDYRNRLGEVEVSTLVLAGRRDPQMPPTCAEELATCIRHSQLVVFEQSGHYPFLEVPEKFWVTVRAFLTPPLSEAGAARPPSREGITIG
jgi:pimeloyl-ACP methyl ester carboxylesterase